jgi:hypothetical protein
MNRRITTKRSKPDEALYMSLEDPSEALLASRGITLSAAQYYGLKQRGDAWVLPLYDLEGTFIGWQEKSDHVRNRPVGMVKTDTVFGYLQMQHIETDFLVVVESPLDVVLAFDKGCPYPVVALCGSKASESQMSFLSQYAPILALDNDTAGKRGQEEISRELSRMGRRHRIVVYPEGAKDFGDCPDQIPTLVENALDSLMLKMQQAKENRERNGNRPINLFASSLSSPR